MIQDWSIKGRSDSCNFTGKAFADGEYFYAALFRNPDETLLRRDFSEEAWKTISASINAGESISKDQFVSDEFAIEPEIQSALYGFWRSKFVLPPPPSPDPLPKENAETMLRNLLSNSGTPDGRPAPEQIRMCYLLAIMLERKKILKVASAEISPKEDDSLIIYEHSKTGEFFLIVDPKLHLGELEEVQKEITQSLAGTI